MNVRSIRGPNWLEASVSVTIMIENTTPTTVMIAAASDDRICLAASGEPLITQDGRVSSPWDAALSMLSVTTKSRTAATLSAAGISHRLVRSDSSRQSDSTAKCRKEMSIARPVLVEFSADQTSRLTWPKNTRPGRLGLVYRGRGRRCQPMTRYLTRDRAAIAAAVVVPLALAAILLPWRGSWPNTNVALLLVVAVVAVAAAGSRIAGALAAVSAAAWFDFFYTLP